MKYKVTLSPGNPFQPYKIAVRGFQFRLVIHCASCDDQIARRNCGALSAGIAGEVVSKLPYLTGYREFGENPGEIPQYLFFLVTSGAIP